MEQIIEQEIILPHPAGTRDPKGLLPAVCAAGAIGYLASSSLPIVIGALMDGLKIDEAKAGILLSLELGMVAVGSIGLSPIVDRVSRNWFAIGGALLMGLGCLLAAMSHTYAPLAAARMVAGLGAGLILAAGNAAAASAVKPDQFYAIVGVAGAGFAAAINIGLPFAVGPHGFRGGYAALGVLCILSIPFYLGLPANKARSASDSVPPPTNMFAAILTISAVLVFWFADQSLWAFSERIGLQTGISLDNVGLILGLGLLAGLVGGTAAALLGEKLGRIMPLVAGLTAVSLLRWGVVQARTPTQYTAMQLLWAASFFFTLPYLMGTAARLDRKGRWTAVAGGMSMAGTALGPGIAGAAVAKFGYPFLGWFVLILSFAALALILPAVVAIAQKEKASALK